MRTNESYSLATGVRSWVDSEVPQEVFGKGNPGFGKKSFQSDFFVYFPDGRTECHEVCFGCRSNGSCPFYPSDFRCDEKTGQWKFKTPRQKKPKPEKIEILPASSFKTGVNVYFS